MDFKSMTQLLPSFVRYFFELGSIINEKYKSIFLEKNGILSICETFTAYLKEK